MPGQSGAGTGERWALTGVALGAVLVLLAATGVALSGRAASAQTVLREGAGAQLVGADGALRAAVVGRAVPEGSTVRAGGQGAVLATAGREVHLAPAAEVTVVDGGTQALLAGDVLVDTRDAPGLDLSVEGATVAAAPGSVVRVEDRASVRIAQLAGVDAQLMVGGGPVSLPGWHQLTLEAAGPTPALLRDDDLERRVLPDLVTSDLMLAGMSTELARGGSAPVVQAALQIEVPDSAAPAEGVAGGERALAYLMASSGDPQDVPGRLSQILDLREAGGSWAVVAALLDIDVDDVGARLAQLLAPEAPVLASGGDGVAAVVGALTGGASAGPGSPGGPDAAPAGPGAASGEGAPAAGDAGGSPGPGREPEPSPSPPGPGGLPVPVPRPSLPVQPPLPAAPKPPAVPVPVPSVPVPAVPVPAVPVPAVPVPAVPVPAVPKPPVPVPSVPVPAVPKPPVPAVPKGPAGVMSVPAPAPAAPVPPVSLP